MTTTPATNEPTPPTHADMMEAIDTGPPDPGNFDGHDLFGIETKIVGSWRWGVVKAAVFVRLSDKTWWRAKFQVSTDGETNGLRDGNADVHRVYPHEQTVTIYTTKP